MIRRLDRQIGRELDELLAVARRLGEVGADVRPARERVRRDRVQRVVARAVRRAAPTPDAAASALLDRHAVPRPDLPRGELDALDTAERRRVAIRGRRDVHGSLRKCHRTPDELATEVREHADWPAGALAARRDVECVEAAEGVGYVERAGSRVDGARAEDSVAVELPARLRELP